MRGRALMGGVVAAGFLFAAGIAAADDEQPQYGGTLEIATVFATLSALSWDPADWAWKLNHDAGQFYETLLAADLTKSVGRGGKYPFRQMAYLPADGIRGELAEKWEWETPLSLVITLRKGVMFPEKASVMAARELSADDVVFSYNRFATSAKRLPDFFKHVEKVEARDRHTVVFTFKEYAADWDYRIGWGYFSAIMPKEVADAGATNWKNVNGTGPFRLTDYVSGNSNTYEKNPIYWDKERVGGTDYTLPFIDKLIYRLIKDQATQVTALRTGKIDILEAISWEQVESLKKSAPQLKWSRYVANLGTVLAMRVDTKPFDDVRVRRALNMAIDKGAIVSSFFGGNAELMAYPQHPEFEGYFEPLESMPASIKELFVYAPEKAKRLLVEAGYPNGFSFKVQVCTCAPVSMELLALVVGYLEKVGVKAEIQPMEYGAFLSVQTNNTNAAGYLFHPAHGNPISTIGAGFTTRTYNPSQWNDEAFTEKYWAVVRERDEDTRKASLRAMTREILDAAPYIWLPTPYVHSAWWPWVKNYNGELRAGATRPAPIYARIWIDQKMKASMGY